MLFYINIYFYKHQFAINFFLIELFISLGSQKVFLKDNVL